MELRATRPYKSFDWLNDGFRGREMNLFKIFANRQMQRLPSPIAFARLRSTAFISPVPSAIRKFKLSFSTTPAVEPVSDGLKLTVQDQKAMMISFNCNICSHTSVKKISRQSYTMGVVLIQCSECKNRHLIADNLGWFSPTKINIESIMAAKGETVKKVVVPSKPIDVDNSTKFRETPTSEGKLEQLFLAHRFPKYEDADTVEFNLEDYERWKREIV